MFYLATTPWPIRKLLPGCLWQMSKAEKRIFLTFDDGPHPVATPFVLNELRKYNAKATFFCIGKNVVGHPEIYKAVLDDGHAVGNHTHNHVNGWKTNNHTYMENIFLAKKYIDSKLFRPPYGRITSLQVKLLKAENFQLQPVMWSVLSGDFDKAISDEKCLKNVLKNTGNGSIVVFHDSEKALPKLQAVLPTVLNHFANKGYVFDKIVL